MTCIRNTFLCGFYLVTLMILGVVPAQLCADTKSRSVVVIDLGLEDTSIAKAVGLIENMAIAAPESSSIGLVAASDIVISVIEPMQSQDFLVQLSEQAALLEHSDSHAFPVAIERAMDMFDGNSGKLTLITDGTIDTTNPDFDQQFIDWFGLQQEMAAMQDVQLLALPPVQPTAWLTEQISSDFLLQWPAGDSDTSSVLARILGVEQITVAVTTDSTTSDSEAKTPSGAEADLTLAARVENDAVEVTQPTTSDAVTNTVNTNTDTAADTTEQATTTIPPPAETIGQTPNGANEPDTERKQPNTAPTPTGNTATDSTNDASTESTLPGNTTPSRSTDISTNTDINTDALAENTTSNDSTTENTSKQLGSSAAPIEATQHNLPQGAGGSLVSRIDTQAKRFAQLLTNTSTSSWLVIAGTLVALAVLMLLLRILRRGSREAGRNVQHSTTAQHPLANGTATSSSDKKGADPKTAQDAATRANPLQQPDKQQQEDNAFSSTALHSLLGDTTEHAVERESEKTKMQPLGASETDSDTKSDTGQALRHDDQSADTETNEFAIIDKLISKNNKE